MKKNIIFLVLLSGFVIGSLTSCNKGRGYFYYRLTMPTSMQNYDIKATENGKAINITWLTNYQGEFISQERKPKVNLTTHLKAHFGQYSLSYGITIYTRDRNGNDKTIKLYTSNGNITWQQ